MNPSRRTLLGLAAMSLVSVDAIAKAILTSPSFSAVLFDGFALFDLRPVFAEASRGLDPDAGKRFVDTWRSRQFEYQWLHAMTGNYVDFERCVEDALLFAARQANIPLTESMRQRIMAKFQEVVAWPDVLEGLTALKRSIPRVGLLSNMTAPLLRGAIQRSGLAGLIDDVLSTDAVRTFKPEPRAYALGTDTLHMPREKILFVAFAGWDAAGGRRFGYPTFWLNRAGAPAEELGIAADSAGADMPSLLAFVAQRQKSG